MKFIVIIPASGSGVRFGGKTPKQFIKLKPGNKEVAAYSINKFQTLKEVSSIVIACEAKYVSKLKQIVKSNKLNKVADVVEGGKTRQDSVYNALKTITCGKNDRIIIHDAVRPFISRKKIKELIKVSKKADAVIPALKINDTIKKVSPKGYSEGTIPRDNIWRVQTPQVFEYGVLMKSFEKAYKSRFNGTDEASIVEHAGYKVKVIEGETTNIKITTKEDLQVVDFNKLLK